MSGEPMLEIRDLVGGYGSVQILNGASLRVERGQIVALLGGNGTGKSTLLKATSGLLRAWSGTITFDGERIDGMRPDTIVRRGLVQVTQGKEAFPGMMVEQNVRMALLLAGYGYVIKDGLIQIEGPADKMINDENVRLSYLGGTIANREARL